MKRQPGVLTRYCGTGNLYQHTDGVNNELFNIIAYVTRYFIRYVKKAIVNFLIRSSKLLISYV